MSSITYQIDAPRWLWALFKDVLNENPNYDRYNDRVVENIVADVERFADAGLIELDDRDEQRLAALRDDLDGSSLPGPHKEVPPPTPEVTVDDE